MSEGNCSVDNPIIACPLVQPPAYRVPKPTKNPPTTIIIKPLNVNRLFQLNKSAGTKPLKSVIPFSFRDAANEGLISTLVDAEVCHIILLMAFYMHRFMEEI